MERHCQNPECGKLLIQKDGEDAWHFSRRSTCDHECGRAKRLAREAAVERPEPRCVICGSTKVRKAGRRTCERRACRNEYRDRRAAERAAKKVAAEASARTWIDPAGNVHTLPSNIALREEYKASIRRRIKRGEGVAMIGKVRVYEGPVTKVAA